MGQALDRLRLVLDDERAAAIRADLPALERIAVEKASLVEGLDRDEVERDPGYAKVVERAQRNVRLLQKLTDLHRALLGGTGEPTYNARGAVTVGEGGGALLRRTS